MTLALGILVLGTIAAAAVDVRTRRIPNALCGALALAGIALHVPHGLSAVLLAVTAMLVAFVFGCFAFSVGWFGGGDVKLVSACCALVGFPGAEMLVLEILAAGALLALAEAARRGRLVALVRSTAEVAARRAPTERIALPYAVAIAAGSLVHTALALVPALRSPL